MAGIIAPSRAKSIAELQRFIMDWELRVAEHEARHNECVQDSVEVAALNRMMTAEMAERYIEGPITYPELRSRVAAYVGKKMIQQSHVPMDIGEVEGEIESSDDHIDELRGIGFRGAGGKRIRNHGQRKFKVRMREQHVAGTTWQVADVKRPLMSVAKMVAARNHVHLDSKDPRKVRLKGDVIPLRKAGNVFVVDLWVRKDATSRRLGFHRQAWVQKSAPQIIDRP